MGTGCWPRNEDGNLTGFLSKHGRCRHTVAGPVAEDDDIAGVADGVTAPPRDRWSGHREPAPEAMATGLALWLSSSPVASVAGESLR